MKEPKASSHHQGYEEVEKDILSNSLKPHLEEKTDNSTGTRNCNEKCNKIRQVFGAKLGFSKGTDFRSFY